MRTFLIAAVVSLTALHGPVQGYQKPKATTKADAKVATEAEVDAKIQVADSSKGPAKIYAVEWFTSVHPPNDQVKAKVAKKLLEWLDDRESSVRGRAADALANWATQELAPRMMIEMVGNKPALRKGSIIGLGRIQYEKAIPTLVRYLESNIERPKVTEALVLMGPKAETAVLKVLDNKDQAAVRQACFILMQIGTSKSLPALERVSTASPNRETAATAASAIDAIKDRQAGGGQR
jgi:HEAT repeat protein